MTDLDLISISLTSNKGSADFQREILQSGNEALWEKVLSKAQEWGSADNLMFVVGATHPEAFKRVRELAPDHFLLVPGVGAQGGDLESICKYGLNKDYGLLINASRSILYAASGADFAEKARAEAMALRDQMKVYI